MQTDDFSLLGRTQVEARRVVENVVREEKAARSLRGENYQKNWDMFNGDHQLYFKQRLDEEDNIFDYRKKNAVKVNWCGFTVNLSAKYLYGKASKIVRSFSKKIETHKKMAGLVKDTYLDSFLLGSAAKTSTYGECPVRLIPVDTANGKPVKDGASTETTVPFPIMLDPRWTFIKRNEYGKIEAVVVFYTYFNYPKGKLYTVCELIVDDSRWMWEAQGPINLISSTYLNTTGAVSFQDSALMPVISGEKNLYSLENEFVQFVNNDDLKSDLVDILQLNVALDEAYTDKQHFFQKHGWPKLVTEVDLQNVQFSPNKIWQISSDFGDTRKVEDRFHYLTWDGKMEDHAKYISNLERNIMIMSYTAAISTGDLQAIGQLRSGAALITSHSVAIHKTEAKQIVWERNERKLFKAIAAFDSYLHNTTLESRYPGLEIEIRFPRDFVPGAEYERAQIQQIQIQNHIKPLDDILEDEYGGLDKEGIAEKRAKIIKDSREIVDSDRRFESVKEGGGGSSQKSSEQSSGEMS